MKRIATPVNFILFLVSFFTTFRLDSQGLTSDELAARLKEYLQDSPREEIYLHIDREKYIAGEDIWFSIYNIDRETTKLSARSTIAYVELLNPWNRPIIQTRIQLSDGRGKGNFSLPDSITSGTYTIRAYTNWIKNFLPDNCYMNDIEIFNTFSNSDFIRKVNSIEDKPNSFTLRFFPEGGKLLNGIVNKVVASCINYTGEGVPFTGIIRDMKGDSVTHISTDESGYGSFFISPAYGNNYSVSANGVSFSLPEAMNDGFAVAVDNSLSDSIEIAVTAVGSYGLPLLKDYLLVIQTYGKTEYINNLKIKDTVTKITVPGERIIGGVSQITLIGKDGMVMYERMIYFPRKNESQIEVTADSIYNRREKVSLRLGIVNNDEGQSGISEMSISVTNADVSDQWQGIDDYFIFGSESCKTPMAKGKICLPDINPDMLDNFLICSESRWIRFQDLLSGKPVPKQYRFESEGHYLSVIIKNREDNISDSSNYLYMSIQGKVAEFRYAERDSAGRFNFILPVDDKFRNLILQPEYANNNMILEIEPSFSWIFPESYSFKDTMTEAQLDLFSALSFNYQAAKIYGIQLKKEAGSNDNGNQKKRRFYGIPEMEIYLDDYIRLPSMQEIFYELLPGIVIRPRKSGYDLQITNPLTGTYYDQPPLVMIDGVIINDLAILVDLDPEIVEKVEVVKSPYLIGDLILHGIVNVITRTGNFSDITMPDYAAILPYRVIDKPYAFTSPDYSDEAKRLNRTPDLRNTLYWNPSVKTGLNGEAEIQFWTSDFSGNYIISIQGISGTGERISVYKSFMVR